MTAFLLKKYAEMSGDKKVRIAFDLSKMARRIRNDGKIAKKRLFFFGKTKKWALYASIFVFIITLMVTTTGFNKEGFLITTIIYMILFGLLSLWSLQESKNFK